MAAVKKTSSSFRSLPKNLLLAIFLLFALLLLLVSLVFVRIVVPGYKLNNQFRLGYTVLTTLLATALSRFAASEIQKQWLRYISHEISDVKYQLLENSSIAPRWRAVLGLSNLDERYKHFSSTGLTQLSFLATGLITAAAVAASTLQDTVCVAQVPAPRIHSGGDSNCARNIPNVDVPRTSPLWEYRTFWNRPDGSAYFATTSLGCPSWSGAQFLGAINTVTPRDFAYTRNGVEIDDTAIGAPEIFYTQFPEPSEPDEPFGEHIFQSKLQSVSQCLPVMASNPIKCVPGGQLSFASGDSERDGDHSISISAGGCSFNQTNYEDPKSPFGLMVSRLCTSNGNSNASVGQGTIAIGATNIMSLTLAAAMGDTNYLEANANKYDDLSSGKINNLSYSLSCSIDVVPTIQWKTLNLTLQAGALNTTASPYSKRVTAIDGCKNSNASVPQSAWALGDSYAAGAVAALVPPLSEGRYWNGMLNAILNQALNVSDSVDHYANASAWTDLIRNAPFGFATSNNALEDVFGLTAGITMSQMSTIDSQSPGSPLEDSKEFFPPIPGVATFACTRVGPGETYALIFCVPTVVALAMACYLLWATPKSRTAWKTSRLEDLIHIGRASERELSVAYRADHRAADVESQSSQLSMSAAPMGTSLYPPGQPHWEDYDMKGQPLRRSGSDRSVSTMNSSYGVETARGPSPFGWNNGLYPPPPPPMEPVEAAKKPWG